jgi:hypothetical protein
MRYAIFGALILSLELVGAIHRYRRDARKRQCCCEGGFVERLIPVMQGCGAKYKRNKQTGQCGPY